MKYLYLFIIAFGRLIPHIPNFTPTTNLVIFGGKNFSRRLSIILTVIAICFSDILLSFIYNYPLFGLFSIFTYSGFVFIILAANYFKNSNTFFILIFSELFYWTWTNLGSFFINPIYSKNISGLISCYVAALPFLRNELFGDVVWFVVIFGSFFLVEKKLKIGNCYVK